MRRLRRCGWVRRAAVAATLCAAWLVIGPGAAPAKEGFFIGGGLTEQSAGGDLDGEKEVQLDAGRGLALKFGYGFSRNFAVEYLMLGSEHTATDDVTQRERDATLSGNTIALRGSGRIAGSLEGFVRLGNSSLFGGYTLEVTEVGTTRELDGNGTSLGAGVEWFLGGRTGIEVSYMRHEVTLKDDRTYYTTADRNLNVSIDSVIVIIGLYF